MVPVERSGNKDWAGNFHPISLKCICCKMFDHKIASHSYAHLKSKRVFGNHHGFSKGLSCETQHFEFIIDLHCNMKNKIKKDCISFEFAKAFDHAAYCRFLLKLSALKLDYLALPRLRNFPTSRKQFTALRCYSSSLCYVSSRVPQGSVLGHLLFSSL